MTPVIRAVLESTVKTVQHRAVLVPSALATIGTILAFRALGTDDGFWLLRPPAMALLAVVLGVRFWIGLSVSATALTIMRAGYRWRPARWLSPVIALEAGLVSLVLFVPVAAALIFLIVPGVVLALRWSQAAMLIVDHRSAWLDAAEASADLTYGRKPMIFAVWMIAGAALGAAGWIGQTADDVAGAVGAPVMLVTIVDALFQIAADAFSLVLVAAVYHALDAEGT
jgi:hypothetical protein